MISGSTVKHASSPFRYSHVTLAVYDKDLGAETLDEFIKMGLFNPDSSWTPVRDESREPGGKILIWTTALCFLRAAFQSPARSATRLRLVKTAS
jgi:Protein of unknown function (DUF2950)